MTNIIPSTSNNLQITQNLSKIEKKHLEFCNFVDLTLDEILGYFGGFKEKDKKYELEKKIEEKLIDVISLLRDNISKNLLIPF
jgi:hypothetical protein